MTHTPVEGYRDVSEVELAIVNQNKQIEERIIRDIERCMIQTDVEMDKRWLAMARSYIQLGYMCWNRGVMTPQRVTLPEDEEDLWDQGTQVLEGSHPTQ